MTKIAEERETDVDGDGLYDILIIGGGINGAGIARDAAGRGYKVCLCEAGDPGGATSSASTKLIHGGLRYLEHYKFRLVREALMERERLWQAAPHIIWPLRFVLPHHKGLRPAWLLRLGLFFYDHLGGRQKLAGTRTLDLRNDQLGRPLKPIFHKAFEYADCWVDDARLVILNLLDAQERGAKILTRAPVTSAQYKSDHWLIRTKRLAQGKEETLRAKIVINAAGPWVDLVRRNVFSQNDANSIRLVRGSHIVLPKLFDHDRAYIFQNTDRRIVFAIPYEKNYTLVGTTDVEHEDTETRPEISPAECSYLCESVSQYFEKAIGPEDVVWTYSGVRPLYQDGASAAQEATRDYVIRREDQLASGTVINIFGGKITTYRRLAEAMMQEVEETLGAKGEAWTGGRHLPGGDFAIDEKEQKVKELEKAHPYLPKGLAHRYFNLYGTRSSLILRDVNCLADLGKFFSGDFSEAELRYLIEEEWVETAEDALFRRTKLGLSILSEDVAAIDQWIKQFKDNANHPVTVT